MEWEAEGVRLGMQTALLKVRMLDESALCACGEAAYMVCYTCSVVCHMCPPCMLSAHSRKPNHCLMIRRTQELGLVPFVYETIPTLPCFHECPESGRSFVKMFLVGMNASQHYYVEVCNCKSRAEQLVALGYWPTRCVKPTFAFSLDVMKLYRSLNLNASTATRAFCKSLYETGIYNSDYRYVSC